MTPRSRTGAFCVRTAVSSCLCFCACPCPSIASPFPVPHGPSVFYQDHTPLGAQEPGGGSGSLHDHRICPPVLGGSLPEEVSSHLVLMPLQMPPPPRAPPHPPRAATLGDSEDAPRPLSLLHRHPCTCCRGTGHFPSCLFPGSRGCSSDSPGLHPRD